MTKVSNKIRTRITNICKGDKRPLIFAFIVKRKFVLYSRDDLLNENSIWVNSDCKNIVHRGLYAAFPELLEEICEEEIDKDYYPDCYGDSEEKFQQFLSLNDLYQLDSDGYIKIIRL